jgi:hypothetical protein
LDIKYLTQIPRLFLIVKTWWQLPVSPSKEELKVTLKIVASTSGFYYLGGI